MCSSTENQLLNTVIQHGGYKGTHDNRSHRFCQIALNTNSHKKSKCHLYGTANPSVEYL